MGPPVFEPAAVRFDTTWIAPRATEGGLPLWPLELGEGGDLLEKILQSSLALNEAPSRAAFVSALTPQQEITVNMLDLERSHEHAALIAQNLWFGLAAAFYRNQRSVAAAQLHKPGLSPSERTELQVRVAAASKQILDLQSCLNDF